MTSPTEPVPDEGLILPEQAYKILKALAQVIIPAASTLYFTLGTIWNWPNIEQIVGTLAAIDVFLGILLTLSTAAYNKSTAKYAGAINVTETPEGTKVYSLDLDSNPEDMDQRSEVTFKVNPSQ